MIPAENSGKKGGLLQKIASGGLWISFLKISSRLLGLAKTVVLARVLAPNDFGLFGIALLSLSALEVFSKIGLNLAIIQNRNSDRLLNSAWTLQVFRGLILAVLLAVFAPWIADFFNEPKATNLIRVLGLYFLFRGFINIRVVYFKKELQFKSEFLYNFAGSIAGFCVAIVLAILTESVWALIIASVFESFVLLILSYVLTSYRPRIELNLEKSRELINFGKWILGMAILHFLALRGDDIFLGKILGATALGFYQMAYQFSNLIAAEISNVISSVILPVFAKLQDDAIKLRKSFLETFEILAVLLVPFTVILFLLATEFVLLILGEKWAAIIPVIQVLAFSGLIRGLTGDQLFAGVGFPNFSFWWRLARFITLASLIYPLTVYGGMVGVAYAVLIAHLVGSVFWLFFVKKVLKFEYKTVLIRLVPCMVSTFFAAFIIKLFIILLPEIGYILFVIITCLFAIIYTSMLFFIYGKIELYEKSIFVIKINSMGIIGFTKWLINR